MVKGVKGFVITDHGGKNVPNCLTSFIDDPLKSVFFYSSGMWQRNPWHLHESECVPGLDRQRDERMIGNYCYLWSSNLLFQNLVPFETSYLAWNVETNDLYLFVGRKCGAIFTNFFGQIRKVLEPILPNFDFFVFQIFVVKLEYL
jgi:hypothetical protein